MKNRTIAFIRVDNCIDLITNSSSELFVIRAEQPKEVIESILAEELGVPYSFEVCCLDGDPNPNDEEWEMERVLSAFPEDKRAEIKQKYLSDPKWYCVIIDRDLGYDTNYAHHDTLKRLGFHLETSDY